MILISAALLLGLLAGMSVCAEETAETPDPEAGHQPDHTVRQQLHGQPECISAGEEGHILRVAYDLYCEDCQEIVAENVAGEESPLTPHEWRVEETESTCTEDGVIRKTCVLCGFETEELLPPASHQWVEEQIEPTCTEDGVIRKTCELCGFETEESLPALGHQWYEERIEPTCAADGALRKTCEVCGEETEEVLPALDHQWREERTEPTCTEDGLLHKVCEACGEETEEILPALGHQWVAVSYSEPTCTERGVAVRQCAVCGVEEQLEIPALPHCYVWMDVPTRDGQGYGLSELRCVLCGDVAETRELHPVEMLYNNTITSYGPTTRELIGGSVWNRVTPIDLSKDGVFTYPLVASNRFTVGTAMVVIENGIQTVTFRLNASEIQIHSESLVIYPDLYSLRTGENAVSCAFGEPIDTAAIFGDDHLVILAITLKADYNILADGVQFFSPDESQIEAMTRLID